jgi:hypothetical protein
MARRKDGITQIVVTELKMGIKETVALRNRPTKGRVK